jgi:hypothetical protein
MGKDLHSSIIYFFKEKLSRHQAVESFEEISTPEYYIFRVTRRGDLSPVTILLSDSYYYGEFDSLSLPQELNNGGMVLIARPEAHFSDETQDNDLINKVITGKIGVILGALTKEEFWKYEKPKKEENKT